VYLFNNNYAFGRGVPTSFYLRGARGGLRVVALPVLPPSRAVTTRSSLPSASDSFALSTQTMMDVCLNADELRC